MLCEHEVCEKRVKIVKRTFFKEKSRQTMLFPREIIWLNPLSYSNFCWRFINLQHLSLEFSVCPSWGHPRWSHHRSPVRLPLPPHWPPKCKTFGRGLPGWQISWRPCPLLLCLPFLVPLLSPLPPNGEEVRGNNINPSWQEAPSEKHHEVRGIFLINVYILIPKTI